MTSEDNKELCQIIEKNLMNEMERTKDWPIIDKKKVAAKIESASTQATSSGEDSSIKSVKDSKKNN